MVWGTGGGGQRGWIEEEGVSTQVSCFGGGGGGRAAG